jgi:hypothetical protein
MSIYEGDQSKLSTMKYLTKRGPWHVIVDDGSHVPQHEIYTLFHLWNALVSGGLYIIEDLETNYWMHGRPIYDYFLQHTGIHADVNHSAVVKLTQFIHVLNRHQLQMRDHMSIMPHDDEICSLEFGINILLLRNCGLVTDGPGPQNLDMQGNVDMAELAVWVAQAKASNPVAD